MLAVKDFNSLQARVNQSLQQTSQFGTALRKPNRVSERRHASALGDSPNPLFECGFIAIDRSLGLVGKVEIKGLLDVGHVSFVTQHSGEMRTAHLVAPVNLGVFERDCQPQLLQFGNQIHIALTPALLLALEPPPKLRWKAERAANSRARARTARVCLARSASLGGCSIQLHKSVPVRARQRPEGGIVAGERIVISDRQRFDALANGKAHQVSGIGGAIRTVRMCVQVDHWLPPMLSDLLDGSRVHVCPRG